MYRMDRMLRDADAVLFHRVVLLLCLVFMAVLLRTAWLGDDAFITFRTVMNVTHGHGLTFNIAERVQSYTHPLWLTRGRLQDDSAGDVAARLPIGLPATGDPTPRRRPHRTSAKARSKRGPRRRARNRPFHSDCPRNDDSARSAVRFSIHRRLETSVLPLKFDAEFLAVQDRGDAIDSSPGCGPNCVKCLRDGTVWRE